jgi:hypothetical protein
MGNPDLSRDRLAADPATRQLANRGHDLAPRSMTPPPSEVPKHPPRVPFAPPPEGSELVSRGGQYHCRSTDQNWSKLGTPYVRHLISSLQHIVSLGRLGSGNPRRRDDETV